MCYIIILDTKSDISYRVVQIEIGIRVGFAIAQANFGYIVSGLVTVTLHRKQYLIDCMN